MPASRRRWCSRRPTAGTGRSTRSQRAGATVHLAHPLGVKAFAYRRVKNDRARRLGSGRPAADGAAAGGVDRAAGNAGTARAGPAPGQAGRAAIPLQGRGPRGAGQVRGPGADDRPVRGRRQPSCWTKSTMPAPYAARIASLRRLIEDLDFEIDLFAGIVRGRLARRPRLHRGPADPRDRAGAGGGVRRRDRRRHPVPRPPPSWPAGPG